MLYPRISLLTYLSLLTTHTQVSKITLMRMCMRTGLYCVRILRTHISYFSLTYAYGYSYLLTHVTRSLSSPPNGSWVEGGILPYEVVYFYDGAPRPRATCTMRPANCQEAL